MKLLGSFLSSLGLFLLACHVDAANTLQVIDQNNQPVINAVVAIPTSTRSSTASLPIAIMDQVNKQFKPRVLVIQQGQSVSFPNSDDIRHQVYSFSSINPFNIRLYKGSEEPPIPFNIAGIGVLGCNIHDSMVGYIYVAGSETAKVTDHDGKVQFDSPIPDSVTVWHESLSVNSNERQSVMVTQQQGLATVHISLLAKDEEETPNTFKPRTFGSKG